MNNISIETIVGVIAAAVVILGAFSVISRRDWPSRWFAAKASTPSNVVPLQPYRDERQRPMWESPAEFQQRRRMRALVSMTSTRSEWQS